VFENKALLPKAMLSFPEPSPPPILLYKAYSPKAMLPYPVVFAKLLPNKAFLPKATLEIPVVL
jgi:hypothetical protein